MSEELFQFRKGDYAKKIKELIKREIEESSPYTFKPLENISFNRVKIIGDKYYYSDGVDSFIMFAYKDRYDTVGWGKSPSYHVCDCKTRIEHSNFVYGNKMPVSFYDTGTETHKTESLDLCKNCAKDQSKMIWGLGAKGKPWYEYVIQEAAKIKGESKDLRPDKYIRLWSQLSQAIREKNNYCCSGCGVDLNENDKRMFLDVHHVSGDKLDNKESNLEPLCAVCHASVNIRHEENFMNYPDSKNRLSTFIRFNEDLISKHNSTKLKFWKKKLDLS